MCAKKISQAAFLTFSILYSSHAFAQNGSAKYEIGLNAGVYIYQGDLAPGRLGSLKTIKPGIGLTFAKIITPSFTIRANVNLASLKGDETKYEPAYRKYRALKFQTSVKELNVMGQWNILGNQQYASRFEPYLFAGAGVSFINVTRDYSGFIPEYFSPDENLPERLAEDLAQRTRRTIPVIPAGLGLRYNLSPSLAINLETTYRFTNSDYVDGYSRVANPDRKDNYLGQTIGISYKIGSRNNNKTGCPVMKY